jgi:hypothetical protein
MKICRDCCAEKDDYQYSKYPTGKLRPICNDCLYKMQKSAWDKRPVEKTIRQLAWGVLQRVNPRSENPKNKCYRDNKISCEIGESTKDVYKYLYDNFKGEVEDLLNDGHIPSVDRIDPAKNYTKDNIRIISLKDNLDRALSNAHKKLSRGVLIKYKNGEIREFNSAREAERVTGICRNTINAILNGKRENPEEFTISQIKER